MWCIRQSKQLLGPDVCDHILFVHAILGCDVTSRLFGLRKGLAVKMTKSDFQFCQQAKVFNQSNRARERRHNCCRGKSVGIIVRWCLRVYYHVMYWKGKGHSMKPEECGWHIVD